MESVDDPHETEPLRRESTVDEESFGQSDLRVLDIEKHVLDPANPREIVRFPPLDQRNLLIIGVVALLTVVTLVVCWAVLSDASGPDLVKRTDRRRGDPDQKEVNASGPVPYDFVGEGNCKPNRPQWARKVRYQACRARCDAAAACIGFDWDARWTFCRVRFATNAAIASPPRGWQAIAGREGGRIARQATGLSIGGIAGIEGSHTAGCFQKATSVPFHRFLSRPDFDGEGHALVGPLPTILDYYWETGLMGPLRASARHLQAVEQGLLACNGSEAELVLPSLDVSPLLRALRAEELDRITLMVGLNSDSANLGLGLAIEASPQLNETTDGTPFVHNWYGDQRNRNVIKFYPGVAGGQFSIAGPGGFGETSLGFTPRGWTSSGANLHVLEITTGVDGVNEVKLWAASGGLWRRTWRHKLFDGKDIPSLYAFIQSGGEPGKPLLVGRVTLLANEVYT